MTKLDQLYDLRERVEAAIVDEVRRLEADAKRERERLEAGILAEQESRRLAVMPRNRKNLTVAICGTETGYTRHRRTLDEPACDACKAAHRLYERQRLARKRATESTACGGTPVAISTADRRDPPQIVNAGLYLIENDSA